MNWRRRSGVREHLRTVPWPVPFASALASLVAAAISWRLDEWGGWTLPFLRRDVDEVAEHRLQPARHLDGARRPGTSAPPRARAA